MANQTSKVIDTIIQRIDTGVYLPGTVLDETRLAEEIDVSRTPVREAFIQLETEGLIVRGGRRRGAEVFKPNTDQFLNILEVHAQLEAQAAELAARRITEELIKALNDNLSRSITHHERHGDEDHAGYYQLNLSFHDIILTASGNPFLGALIRTNARKLMAYYRNRYAFKGATAASLQEHQAIADLICAGDAAGARKAMAQHFEYDLDTVMDLLAVVS